MTELTDKQKGIMADIDATFSEIQHRVNGFYGNLTDDQLARLNKNIDSDIATNRPVNVGANQHLGIVHGSEFVISAADDKVRRELLDKYCEGENFMRCTDDDGEVATSYTEYVFFINHDSCSRIANDGGWVCVADFNGLREDDLRYAVDMLDAPNGDSSCADIISKSTSENEGVFLATGSTPYEAIRLVCEKIDAK